MDIAVPSDVKLMTVKVMAREIVAATDAPRQARARRPATSRPVARTRVGLKSALLGVVGLCLLGLVGVAALRESAPTAAPAQVRPAVATPRPALSAAEESYAQALWPIHNEVKSGALKMTMSGIQYKTQRLDVAGLHAQVLASLEAYRRAEAQIRELQPPASLVPAHEDYLRAVTLYQQSATEMARLADDLQEQHLLDAFPLSQEAGRTLRAVGAQLWPGEYVPN